MNILKKIRQTIRANFLDEECNALEIYRTHSKIFPEFQFCNKGRKLAIVATGESLVDYKPIEDLIYLGVNRAVEKKFNYDYFFLQDISGAHEYINKINALDCEKFYGRMVGVIGNTIIPEEYFSEKDERVHRYYTSYPLRKFKYDITVNGLADYGSVVFSAFHFALWTYPEEIYLIGCDCTNSYFTGKKSKNFSFLLSAWKEARRFQQTYYPEVRVISVNPKALRGVFEDLDQ